METHKDGGGAIEEREKKRFEFARANAAHCQRYVADMEQLAYARMSELSEGDGRGNRIIEVNNGSGLTFTVVPDRGMDIVEASFRGVPLAWRAPGGHVQGAKREFTGFGWLRAWAGGLLTTCGLRHVGGPEDDAGNPLEPKLGLHGRISSQSAYNTGITQEWRNDRYEIALTGTLREAMMFGENFRLERRITTAMNDNSIYIEDRVINLGDSPEFVQLLYHCNFGYPLIAPGIRLEAMDHQVSPRDDEAAKWLEDWHLMPEPQAEIKEQCFLHHIPPFSGTWSGISIINEKLGLRVAVEYDTVTLPRLMQWKMPGHARYVMGLEPTNTTVSGRHADIASGTAPALKPGKSMDFRCRLSFNEI